MLVSRLVLNLRGYRSLKELSSTTTTRTAAETLTSIPELSFAPYVNDNRGHNGRCHPSVHGHQDNSARYEYESSRLWGNIGAPLETGFGDYAEEPSVPLKSTGAGAERDARGGGPNIVRDPSVSSKFARIVRCLRPVCKGSRC